MEGKTKEDPRRRIPQGKPGKFLMAPKILMVPGAHRAGKTQPPPFLLGRGKLFQEIRQVAMSIRSHASSLE
jgi:hypothetical protein